MKLYWVRHGQMARRGSLQADLQAVNRFFDQQTAGGLSAHGLEQAERVAEWFGRHPPQAVYTSPLERARQTADITAKRLGRRVHVREELRELRTGRLREHSPEGRVVSQLASSALVPPTLRPTLLGATAIPLYYQCWRRERTEGGEPPSELHARLERLFDELRHTCDPHAPVALFAHGYLLFHVVRHVVRRSPLRTDLWRRPYIPHGAITEMELPGQGAPRLERYALTGHLRGPGRARRELQRTETPSG
jgi:broad specificity phosphatase PhoE